MAGKKKGSGRDDGRDELELSSSVHEMDAAYDVSLAAALAVSDGCEAELGAALAAYLDQLLPESKQPLQARLPAAAQRAAKDLQRHEAAAQRARDELPKALAEARAEAVATRQELEEQLASCEASQGAAADFLRDAKATIELLQEGEADVAKWRMVRDYTARATALADVTRRGASAGPDAARAALEELRKLSAALPEQAKNLRLSADELFEELLGSLRAPCEAALQKAATAAGWPSAPLPTGGDEPWQTHFRQLVALQAVAMQRRADKHKAVTATIQALMGEAGVGASEKRHFDVEPVVQLVLASHAEYEDADAMYALHVEAQMAAADEQAEAQAAPEQRNDPTHALWAMEVLCAPLLQHFSSFAKGIPCGRPDLLYAFVITMLFGQDQASTESYAATLSAMQRQLDENGASICEAGAELARPLLRALQSQLQPTIDKLADKAFPRVARSAFSTGMQTVANMESLALDAVGMQSADGAATGNAAAAPKRSKEAAQFGMHLNACLKFEFELRAHLGRSPEPDAARTSEAIDQVGEWVGGLCLALFLSGRGAWHTLEVQSAVEAMQLKGDILQHGGAGGQSACTPLDTERAMVLVANAALAMVQSLDTTCAHYRLLQEAGQRFEFAKKVQRVMAQDLLDCLRKQLSALATEKNAASAAAAAAAAAVMVKTAESPLSDQEKLGTFCRLLNTAAYVAQSLGDLEDQIFYLELADAVGESENGVFTELCDRAEDLVDDSVRELVDFIRRQLRGSAQLQYAPGSSDFVDGLRADLAAHLVLIQQAVGWQVSAVWKELAKQIDGVLHRDVLLERVKLTREAKSSTYTGSRELAEIICSIFTDFACVTGVQVEGLFRRTRDVTTILCLPKDELEKLSKEVEKHEEQGGRESKDPWPVAREAYGIRVLGSGQVLEVLDLSFHRE